MHRLTRLLSTLTPLLAASLIGVLLAAGCSDAVVSAGDDALVPIVEARTAEAGDEVAIEGTVTVASGRIDAGFALQDSTGGIYVTGTEAAVERGDHVRVRGLRGDVTGMAAVEVDSLRLIGEGVLPGPEDVRTAGVGDETAGRLIRVQGRVGTDGVADDQPYGWKIMLDDGSGPLLVFVDSDTGIDVGGIEPHDTLQVTGLSGRYEDHHELLPRTQTDLVTAP